MRTKRVRSMGVHVSKKRSFENWRQKRRVAFGHVAFRNLEKQKKPRRRFLFRAAVHSFRTHPHPPPNANTMSAFLAGSPVVAKVAAKPVAKRNVTVRAAAPSEYVPRSVPFYLTRRTSNRRDTASLRASRLTSDPPVVSSRLALSSTAA